jgi:hypothetical protein
MHKLCQTHVGVFKFASFLIVAKKFWQVKIVQNSKFILWRFKWTIPKNNLKFFQWKKFQLNNEKLKKFLLELNSTTQIFLTG